jgi:hypothetical protein
MFRCLTTSICTFWESLEDESLPIQINSTSSNRPTYFQTPIWGSKVWRLDSEHVALSLNLFHLQRNIERELQALAHPIARLSPIQVLIEEPQPQIAVERFAVLGGL